MLKKRTIIIISSIVMSMALIGSLYHQLSWLSNAISLNEEIFDTAIQQSLENVAEKIEQREINDFVDLMINNIDPDRKPSINEVSKLLVVHFDKKEQKNIYYSNDLIEEDFGPFTTVDGINLKDIKLRKLNTRRVLSTEKYHGETLEGNNNLSNVSEDKIEKIGQLSDIDKALYYTSYRDIAATLPISKRISRLELELNLTNELKKRSLDLNFEYCIAERNRPSTIKSTGFVYDNYDSYSIPILENNEGETDYSLVVSLPQKNKYIISTVYKIGALVLFFTLFIIGGYSFTLYQLLHQKKNSQMKTDFINNMTHEFKTPIATISLALDALKNEKIKNAPQMVTKYLSIVKEENTRMHNQVGQILKISKFEKGKMTMNLMPIEINTIINDAIEHVALIVDSKNGAIISNLKTKNVFVKANMDYLVNALTNVLDNAIKYSEETLQINIDSYSQNGDVIIKISDKGIGMSSSSQKKIFQKFYREHSGNIHNVKGHGLGLAFVKYIIKQHHGHVWVESQKNIGSTFFIKLPKA